MNIFETSRGATHNGPGIRTMVHFKGCNLDCAWCSTPESKTFEQQLSFFKKKCICCKKCVTACHKNAIRFDKFTGIEIDRNECDNCFKCVDMCCSTALSIIGKDYTVAELYNEIMRDKDIYDRSGGGVTFSGGEALVHIDDEFIQLLQSLNKAEISCGFDTAGSIKKEILDLILPYTDFFLWDIKLINDNLHKKYTGVDTKLILSNLRYLDEIGIDIYIRCPIITGINDNDEFFSNLNTLIKDMKSVKEINLIPFHKLGASRYVKIGLDDPYSETKEVSREYLEEKNRFFIENGFDSKIIG